MMSRDETPSQSEEAQELAVEGGEPTSFQVRRVPHVSLRTSALSFLDGALEGWGFQEFVTWVEHCLIRPGRLMTKNPFPHVILWEPEHGKLSCDMSFEAEPGEGFVPHSHVPKFIRHARKRAVAALGEMVDCQPDDRFVRAALFDGRVTRSLQWNGKVGWGVALTEKHALSDQILALLAADLLEHRSDYEKDLSICESCRRVDFCTDRKSRRSCFEQPDTIRFTSKDSKS